MNLNYTVLSRLPNYLLYIAYFTGLLLLMDKPIDSLARRMSLNHRLNPKKQRPHLITSWLETLVQSATGQDIKGRTVCAVILMLFISTLLVTIQFFTPFSAGIASTLIAALPLLFLFAKLASRRSRGSMEGISFVSELHRQFRINNCNMYEAIECVCADSKEYPICGYNAYKLLIHLRDASNSVEISDSIKAFSFAIGTSWGNMLSGCIKLAVEKGTDVSDGLKDIIEQLKFASERAEERKMLNSEASRMALFLAPLLYLSTIWLSAKYLGTSVKEFIHNQFFTAEGFLFFMVIVFLFFANLVLLNLIASEKLDY